MECSTLSKFRQKLASIFKLRRSSTRLSLLFPAFLPLTALLLLLLSLESAAAEKAPPPRKSPTPSVAAPAAPSLILSSSSKDLSLLQDGILSAISPGKALPLRVGLNELMVTAPGYGIRKLRIWLKEGEQRTLDVALQKTVNPLDPIWASAEKPIPSKQLSKKLSVCAWFRSKSKKADICPRQTWLEDILFVEPGLFPFDEMQSLADSKELTQYRSLVNQVFDPNPEVTAKIEDFYTQRGQLKAVKQLTTMRSFFQGDCPRVHALYVEALQVMEDPSAIALFKGFCAEFRNKDSGLENLIKSSKAPAPYLYYHLGRMLLPKSASKALEIANTCLKSNRFDLGCQELALMASAIENPTGPDLKVQRFTIEDGAFRTLLTLETTVPKAQYEQAFFSVIPLLNTYPQSLELYLYLAWINAAEKLSGGSGYIDRKFDVSAILGGPTLEKIIEDLEKFGFSSLLAPIYRLKIRRDPSDPNLWIRLIRAYSQAGNCEEVLSSFKDGAQVLPRFNASLLQTQAACLVELKRFEEAAESYQKILELKPGAWSSPYNLATVYERLNRSPEALLLYKKALELQPTPEIKDDIQFRLLDLEKNLGTEADTP